MTLIRAQRRMTAPARTGPQVDTVTAPGISQALGVVAGAAQDVRAKVEADLERKRIADDNAAFIGAEVEYMERIAEAERRIQKEIPESGDGYVTRLNNERVKIKDDVFKGLPSYVTEDGRKRIDLRVQQMESQSRMSAAAWQDGQVTNYAVSTFEKSVNASAAQVLANPANAQSLFSQTKARLNAIEGRLTPEQKLQLERGAQQQIIEAAVTGFASQGSYAAARDVIGQYAETLDTGQQKALDAIVERSEMEAEGKVHEARSLAIQEGQLDEAGLRQLREAGEIKDDGAYAALLGQAKQAERMKQAQIDAAMAEQQDRNFATLQVGIEEGRMSKADADLLYNRGQITPAQWSQASRQALSQREKQDAGMAFAQSMAMGFPIDPMNSDAKKGADALFVQQGGVDAWKSSIGDGMAATERFAQKGIIPETAQTILRGMKASGSEGQQMMAIEAISKLYTNYPSATDAAFTAGEVAEAISFRDKLDAGIDPQRAYQALLMEREARNEPAGATSLTKARLAESRKLSADLDFKDALKTYSLEGETVGPRTGAFSFNAYSGGEPAKDQILRDYRQAFQTYFVQHGDEKLAKKQAAATLGRTVGVSKVNGNRIMMHPPERYYPGVEPEWLRDTVTAAVAQIPTMEGVTAKNIELVADIQTARDVRNGEVPSYMVQVKRGDIVETMPVRWTFDEEAAAERAKLRATAQAEKDRTQSRRKALRRVEGAFYQPSPVGTLSAIQQRPKTSADVEFEEQQQSDAFGFRQRMAEDE